MATTGIAGHREWRADQPPNLEPIASTDLARIVDRLRLAGNPLRIVLFGSRARGVTHPGSDLDLLVVEEGSDQPRHHRALPYRMALLGLDVDLDLVVWTLPEIEDWANVPQAFITTILREGKALYERPR